MFAVFGMTKTYATKAAHKKTSAIDGKAKQLKSPEQYEKEIAEAVEKMMLSKRVVKISPDLSTPDIAAEWMRLCSQGEGVRLEVRIHHPYKLTVKNGVEKVSRKWSPYVKGVDYSPKKKK